MRKVLSSKPVSLLAVAMLLAATALPASAAKVYQWKDAKGVTHYSDSPPPESAKAQNRSFSDNGGAEPTAAAKPGSPPNANCSNARANLTVLEGTQPVGIDSDKDGKPDRNLTDTERANRTALAKAQITTYCEGAATTSATTTARAGDDGVGGE